MLSIGYGLGLWCLIQFSTIFQLCRGGQLYWSGTPLNHQSVADKFYHIILYRVHLAMSGIVCYEKKDSHQFHQYQQNGQITPKQNKDHNI